MTIFSSGSLRRNGRNLRTLRPVVPALERRVGEERLGGRVVEVGELEPEEEELRPERCALLRQARDEGTRGASAVSVAYQVRVVDRPREHGLDPLALLDRLGELGRAQLGDLAVVPLPERRRVLSASCVSASRRGSSPFS